MQPSLAAAQRLQFSYPEVGATAGALSAGYRHIRESKVVGSGRDYFEALAETVLRFGMQRGAGLRVSTAAERAAEGLTLLVHLGPVLAPCRVVYVRETGDLRGFAYGTLAGHPEIGEELFAVRYDPETDLVYAEVQAFSRPGTWWSRVGGPVTRLIQRLVTARYLRVQSDY